MKLSKQYTPNDYEPEVYALWETSGSFAPSGKGEPFSVIMPPPNANGNLHIGHALDMNLKDILARYYRLKGRDVAYIPGADHAGFETWVVYERELAKTGKSRFDFSREQLYGQVWDFVDQKRGNMELQLSRELSERRIFPAFDLQKSGTRREDLLLTPEELRVSFNIRKTYGKGSPEAMTEKVLTLLERTSSNQGLLNRLTRK